MLSLISLFLLPLASASSIKPAIDPRGAAPAAGCTNTSFSDFAWTVRNFDYHASYTFTTPAHQNSWGYVNFELYNPADNSVATCSAASSQLSDFYYGTQQYVCDGSTRPVGSPDTKFDFNRPNGTLRVEQGWRCRDQDPQYPITFNGKGAFNLTLDCQETFYQNPNWTIGQIYSSRNVQCKPVDVTVKPYEMTAVA